MSDIKRYLANWRAEQEAIVLYSKLAAAEKNPSLVEVYNKLIITEKKHAAFWENKLIGAGISIPKFRVSLRTKIFGWLAKNIGTKFVLPTVATIEAAASSEYVGQTEAEVAHMPQDERSHARIFNYLSKTTSGVAGNELARFEGKHANAGGNALRAAVLGVNDGLVSVFCLVMGVAGAGVATKQILLTGVAGLLAGALSMAIGEWLSVKNSQELYQHQLDIENSELQEVPEEEKEELALIFQAKGMEAKAAQELANKLISNPETALDTLAREELGIDPKELGGSPWVAAFTSFILFAFGAAFPLVPYLFFTGSAGIIYSAITSTVGLFIIGAVITLLTGKHLILSGLRQVLFGLVTAAVTFGVGHLIGASI